MDTLVRTAMKGGNYDTGYHYILWQDGLLAADRPKEAVAGWELEANTESLCVLADTIDGKLTDAQAAAIKALAGDLEVIIKEA